MKCDGKKKKKKRCNEHYEQVTDKCVLNRGRMKPTNVELPVEFTKMMAI